MSLPILSISMQLFTKADFLPPSSQEKKRNNKNRVNLTFAKMFILSFPNKKPLKCPFPYHNINK